MRQKAEPPEITSLKYNKIFLSHKFKDFHQPRIDLDLPDPKTEELAKSLEERIQDNTVSFDGIISGHLIHKISDDSEIKWTKMYIRSLKESNMPSPSTKSIVDLALIQSYSAT